MGDSEGATDGDGVVGEALVGDTEVGATVGVCDSPGAVGVLVDGDAVGEEEGDAVGESVGKLVGEPVEGDAVVGLIVGVWD